MCLEIQRRKKIGNLGEVAPITHTPRLNLRCSVNMMHELTKVVRKLVSLAQKRDMEHGNNKKRNKEQTNGGACAQIKFVHRVCACALCVPHVTRKLKRETTEKT